MLEKIKNLFALFKLGNAINNVAQDMKPEDTKTMLDKLDGWKTHIVGATTALTALTGLFDLAKSQLSDGFQVADLMAVSHSPLIYAFLVGLGMMTGRAAIAKLAEELR